MTMRTGFTEGEVCWTDLQTSDVGAAKAFYAAIFGWRYENLPTPDGRSYAQAFLGEDLVTVIAPQNPQQQAAGVDQAVGELLGVGGREVHVPLPGRSGGLLVLRRDDGDQILPQECLRVAAPVRGGQVLKAPAEDRGVERLGRRDVTRLKVRPADFPLGEARANGHGSPFG